jgi:thiol-disulfide isomerase/thioredoxin
VTPDDASHLALWAIVLVNLGLTVRLVTWSRRTAQIDEAPELSGPELAVGQRAPTFRARSMTGERVTDRSFAGGPTAFVFVSPNCESCRSTVPKLQPFAEAAGRRGTRIVVVSDSGRKRTGAWLDEIRRDGSTISTPVVTAPHKESTMIRDYDGSGLLPYFCLVSGEGLVQARGVVGRDDWRALTETWAGRSTAPG